MPPVPLVLKIAAFSIAKKISVFVVVKVYGVPRLYRKIIRTNKRLISNDNTRKSVNNMIKKSFRLPKQLWERIRGPSTDSAEGLLSLLPKKKGGGISRNL